MVACLDRVPADASQNRKFLRKWAPRDLKGFAWILRGLWGSVFGTLHTPYVGLSGEMPNWEGSFA